MSSISTLVTRHIPVTLLRTADDQPQAVAILNLLPGMTEITTGSRGKTIQVRYDACTLQFPSLLEALNADHLMRTPGWWTALRFSCYGYMDRNTRDTASTPDTPCCSNPFPDAGKRDRH